VTVVWQLKVGYSMGGALRKRKCDRRGGEVQSGKGILGTQSRDTMIANEIKLLRVLEKGVCELLLLNCQRNGKSRAQINTCWEFTQRVISFQRQVHKCTFINGNNSVK
jgi:hypothetical protein